jgi:hypothetical protein
MKLLNRLTDGARMHVFAVIALLVLTSILGCNTTSNSTASSTTTTAAETVPVTGKVKHVFVVVLENKSFSTTFGSTSPVPFLTQTLASKGAQLSNYYGTGHVSLDNYISMMSGQAGTPQTIADCTTYQDFTASSSTLAANGQILGSGCVYPNTVLTLADQMATAGLTWKAYMGDMGNDPARESATCGHPTLNTVDLTQTAEAPSTAVPNGDSYATRHNPFMYFHSIIDSSACGSHVVNMEKNLVQDLQSVSTTSNLTFITPNLCDDGHDSPCANGSPGGYTSMNRFLENWIPLIMASPAYLEDGLLIINFDESNYVLSASSTGVTITFPGTYCCGETLGPNLAAYPQTTSAGSYSLVYGNYGGDQTGAILLSPFITAGTVSTVPYNHYSMLRTIEDIFGLSQLGNAQATGLTPLGTDVFNNVH